MLDPEEIVLCEHGNEFDDCRVCGAEIDARSRSIFDPEAWAEVYEEQAAPVTSSV